MEDAPDKPSVYAVGIDIGGTKMAVAAVNGTGAILERAVLATEADRGFDRAVARLGTTVERLVRGRGRDRLTGIGVGCAGPVDPRRGLINNPYTLTGWDQCDIVTPLVQQFGVAAYLENDADVAAVGECACGAGQGFDPVVMLTFGTGIGGAAVVRGEIYRGAQGEHPELGHIPVTGGGPVCYCGIAGCLESVASGSAIAGAGQITGFPDAPAVFAAAARGDTAASSIVVRATAAAATAAWTICHTFLPRRLVLGGGIMEEHFEWFARAIHERLAPATQFSRQAVTIAPARLGNDAGIVGAATLALRRGTKATVEPAFS